MQQEYGHESLKSNSSNKNIFTERLIFQDRELKKRCKIVEYYENIKIRQVKQLKNE